MPVEVLPTLRELVRIPSVNSMGRDVKGDIYGEGRVTDFLEQTLRQIGLPLERHNVHPGRDNLIARLDGDTSTAESGPVLLLEAHQDTVPVDGMSIEPWCAEVRDGRVYGRGACDIKGGLASMLSAVSRLADERPKGLPTVVLAFTVNEEYGYSGAAHLRALWLQGNSMLLPRPPDAIIVAEPTLLNVVVAHKGVVRWRCHTGGRAAHSSSPNSGDNAIYRMRHVLAAFEKYQTQVTPELPLHHLVGRPTASVGMIHGGISVNTVPDRCTIEVERRLIPEEDPRVAYQQLVQFINENSGTVDVEHEAPYMSSAGLSDRNNGPLAEHLARIARSAGAPSERTGVPFGTDASELAIDGVPTVVFGPGSVDQAHTKDEWLDVSQLEMATEIIDQFCRSGLALARQ